MKTITDEELNQIFPKNIGCLLGNKMSVVDILNETIYSIDREQILEATSIIRSVKDQAKVIINKGSGIIDWSFKNIDVPTAHKICFWAKRWDKFLSRKLAWYDKRKLLGLPV